MTYVVCATWVARAGEGPTVASALTRLAPASRDEPGNIAYVVHRGLDDPNVFFLYERYADRGAYEAHLASEHFRRALGEASDALASRERTFYETWEV